MTIPEKMRVRRDDAEDWSEEYYVTRVESMDLSSTIKSKVNRATSVTLPQTVISIGEEAFSWMTNLEEVKISPASDEGAEQAMLESYWLNSAGIGDRAFYQCEKLTGIEVPSDCFSNCESLISIVVPIGVEKIGSIAFANCTSLETVVIPKNAEITYLDFAFSGCDPEKLTIYTEEGSFVMENLDANINFYFRCIPVHGAVSAVLDTEDGWKYMEDAEEGIKIAGYDGGLENPVIPEFPDAEVTSVSERVLKDNTAIKSIQIPDTVTYIGADAFNGCTGLTEINLPSGLTYIGDNALKDCGTINNKSIPENIRYIGDYAFCGFRELEKAVICADVQKR